MDGRGLFFLFTLQICLLMTCVWAGSTYRRPVRQVTAPAAFGTNGYCGGYNDVDCSAVCYWSRFNYYQCRPDLCYCF